METPGMAAVRELAEETGLDLREDGEMPQRLRFVGVYEGGGRDPRDTAEAWSRSHAFAIDISRNLDTGGDGVSGRDDADAAAWFDVWDLPDLAFDHARIIRDALGTSLPPNRPELTPRTREEILKDDYLSPCEKRTLLSVSIVGAIVGIAAEPEFPLAGGVTYLILFVFTTVVALLFARLWKRGLFPRALPEPPEAPKGAEWEPLNKSRGLDGGIAGNDYVTHDLRRERPERLEIRPRARHIASMLPETVAAGVFAWVGMSIIINDGGKWAMGAVALLVAAVLAALSWRRFLKSWSDMWVFDRKAGRFWRGGRTPAVSRDGKAVSKPRALSQICAIQILEKECERRKESFTSYEVNAVLGDGTRVSILDHSHLEGIRESARTISEFLGVPVLTSPGAAWSETQNPRSSDSP